MNGSEDEKLNLSCITRAIEAEEEGEGSAGAFISRESPGYRDVSRPEKHADGNKYSRSGAGGEGSRACGGRRGEEKEVVPA